MLPSPNSHLNLSNGFVVVFVKLNVVPSKVRVTKKEGLISSKTLKTPGLDFAEQPVFVFHCFTLNA